MTKLSPALFLVVFAASFRVLAESSNDTHDSSYYVNLQIDGDIESTFSGLTALRAWYPLDTVDFKTSAVCPSPYFDSYVIFAVFTDSDGLDELHFAVVDGDSLSGSYGEVTYSHQMLPANTTRIENNGVCGI